MGTPQENPQVLYTFIDTRYHHTLTIHPVNLPYHYTERYMGTPQETLRYGTPINCCGDVCAFVDTSYQPTLTP